MRKDLSELPVVDLVAFSQGPRGMGPEELVVYGALGCRSEKSALELFLEDKATLSEEKIEGKKGRVLDNTVGAGHDAVLDQADFTFVIKGLPRLATLQICLPQYLQHLQQSLRVVKPGDFYLPEFIGGSGIVEEVVALLDESFAFYERMVDAGIPEEDARYVLPLFTRTNIQTKGTAREFLHLRHMNNQEGMPSIIRNLDERIIQELRAVAPLLFKDRVIKGEGLSWYPGAQLFAAENEELENLIARYGKKVVASFPASEFPLREAGIEFAVRGRGEAGLANIKHIHYSFLAEMSLACFHQAIRQRTWDQSVESIYHAAERGKFITPPKIRRNERVLPEYVDFNAELLQLYWDLTADCVPQQDAVGVLPHSLAVYDLIHVNGWNAIHSIGKRTCTKAQWEIRGIANLMGETIRADNPALGTFVQPQCVVYGACPEKKPCKLPYDRIRGRLGIS